MTVSENIEWVHARIARACQKAGRAPEQVRILPISKKQSPELVRQAAECGLDVFGENRVQEAAQKIPLCPGHLSWHLVGHLQSNKVRAACGLFVAIHSVDSERLLRRISENAQEQGRVIECYLEVNVSGEASKFGLAPEQVPAVLAASHSLLGVDVIGLMTMPPLAPDPEQTRPFFARLRELRDRWREESGMPLHALSMGMSGDFEIAVEEGATCVRLGTVLFGRREA